MKMISSNKLTDGRVIFWTGAGWSADMKDGKVLEDDAADAELEAALKDEATEVVGPYLIAVDGHDPAGRERLRETIRLTGPTTGSTKYVHGIKPGTEA